MSLLYLYVVACIAPGKILCKKYRIVLDMERVHAIITHVEDTGNQEDTTMKTAIKIAAKVVLAVLLSCVNPVAFLWVGDEEE
jgi:hypothetical protein